MIRENEVLYLSEWMIVFLTGITVKWVIAFENYDCFRGYVIFFFFYEVKEYCFYLPLIHIIKLIFIGLQQLRIDDLTNFIMCTMVLLTVQKKKKKQLWSRKCCFMYTRKGQCTMIYVVTLDGIFKRTFITCLSS